MLLFYRTYGLRDFVSFTLPYLEFLSRKARDIAHPLTASLAAHGDRLDATTRLTKQ